MHKYSLKVDFRCHNRKLTIYSVIWVSIYAYKLISFSFLAINLLICCYSWMHLNFLLIMENKQE